MNLIDQLGLDPDELKWEDLSLCRGLPTELFYDMYENDQAVASQVDEICLACPVTKHCGLKGVENEEVGVWGAIYWNGAGKPDQTKNSHKSPEVWRRIEGRLSS